MSNQHAATTPIRYGWIFTLATLLIISLLGMFAADRLYHPAKFQINSIEVSGKFKRVDGHQIKSVVEQAIQGNYFSVSLEHLEQEIASLPWVFSASLRRRWPSTLLVDVMEIEPVAIWGQDRWLNFTGDLVDQQSSELLGLPQISGPDEQQREVWDTFKKWSQLLTQNGLKLNNLKLNDRGLWHLNISLSVLAQEQLQAVMANALSENTSMSSAGGEINTPEAPDLVGHRIALIVDRIDPTDRLSRFVQALNESLMIDFANMQTVDLRYPNGFAIGWLADRGQDNVTETYQ